MKTKVVVNPHSGNGKTAREWPDIEKKLIDALGVIEVECTKGVLDATHITRQALKGGYDRVIAVGGDGTVNEVLNGFFENDECINPEAVLSIIMRGTGGDFRKTIGLAHKVDPAIRALASGTVKPIDIGKLTFVGNDGINTVRYFGNIASFGMGGEVDRLVNASATAKILGGKAMFFWATLRTIVLYKNKVVRIRIDDHFDKELRIRNVAVANGQFFGGGMWIAPKARMDDGLFDIVILEDINRRELIMRTPRVYKGSHLELPYVQCLQGKKVVATSHEEVLLDVDGEAPGGLPATFEIVPKAIRIRC